MSHSPGPWRRSSDTMIHSSTNGFVCRIQRGPLEPKTVHANARLIESAPDLLAALHAVVAALSQPVQSSGEASPGTCAILRGDAAFAVSAARAAIAKAEGHAQEGGRS